MLEQYDNVWEAAHNELSTQELIELLDERELSLRNLYSLANMIALSLEFEHLKDDK